MPNYTTISRVAKILARAGSENANEAAAALDGAYKRMVRDGVTLHDLLSLPTDELYQDTLVKLVDVILADLPDLSPSGKREAYSHYLLLIAAKFSGGASSGSAGQGSRESEAREYEARRAREEAARAQARGESAQSSSFGDKPGKQENSKTGKHNGTSPFASPFASPFDSLRSLRVGKWVFSFSPAAFASSVSVLFGHGSISWYALREPVRALRLFVVCLMFGMAFAMILLLLAATLHALTHTKPLWDVSVRNAFSLLAAVGFLWKARILHDRGWFR